VPYHADDQGMMELISSESPRSISVEQKRSMMNFSLDSTG
jgi:hypothetical protein